MNVGEELFADYGKHYGKGFSSIHFVVNESSALDTEHIALMENLICTKSYNKLSIKVNFTLIIF